ncbi:MAG: hypothetical protein ACRDTG_13745 [Pseudonocardiaceae bacterium]
MLAGHYVIQRFLIPQALIEGLLANIDTADLPGAKAEIDLLWDSGKRTTLLKLCKQLAAAGGRDNANTLVKYIDGYLSRRSRKDPMAGNASWFETTVFDRANAPADQTGIRHQPGQRPTAPAAPTPREQAALAVRSWQVGDLTDAVSWSTLGLHLQGRLSPADYQRLGHDLLGQRDLLSGANNQANATNAQKENFARVACDRVSQEIRQGLDDLPKTPGVSYRAATAAIDVYGTKIVTNDLIKDKSFWSTAALRAGHVGHEFGSEGTLATPKVYYIVNGSTGVYLPKYTNTEVGVRETLYPDQTIFRVTKITNYADKTFFVWITEVDPLTLPPGAVTKNPWSGAQN